MVDHSLFSDNAARAEQHPARSEASRQAGETSTGHAPENRGGRSLKLYFLNLQDLTCLFTFRGMSF